MSAPLYQALLAAQQDFPSLRPDAENPHFHSRFVSLDNLLHNILPVLHRHGLVLTQQPTVLGAADEVPALRTTITHAESGEQASSVMPLLLAKQDPQGQGAAITYARRYALTALLGIAEEDDDANSATPRRRTGSEEASAAGSSASRTPPSIRKDGGQAPSEVSSPQERPASPPAAPSFQAPPPKPPTKRQLAEIDKLVELISDLKQEPLELTKSATKYAQYVGSKEQADVYVGKLKLLARRLSEQAA